MIVMVTGLKSSGKDTIGGWLHNQYGFRTMSFADSLKDVVSIMFGWDRERLEGNNINDRVWRETLDEKWSALLGRPMSPRIALQKIGTDAIRKGFHDDFWILSTISKLNSTDNFCFTDVRFPNEINKIKESFPHVFTINVIRPPLPEWYGSEKKAMDAGIHSSEYTMTVHNNLCDYKIVNDRGIPELCERVDFIIQQEQERRTKRLINSTYLRGE